MTPAPPPPPRLPPRDLLREAAAGLLARPGRVALTVLGTVIGVGALVATIGLSKTAGNQIVGRFSEVAATDVVVTPVPGALGGNAASEAIPWDAETRLRRLNGVAEAGTLSDVAVRGALVRSVPINDPLGQTDVQLPVKAASPGLWATGTAPSPGSGIGRVRRGVECDHEQAGVGDHPGDDLGGRREGVVADRVVARRVGLGGSHDDPASQRRLS